MDLLGRVCSLYRLEKTEIVERITHKNKTIMNYISTNIWKRASHF